MTLIDLIRKSADRPSLFNTMKAISSVSNRPIILALLKREHPMSVTEIAKATGTDLTIASHRLRTLRGVSVVKYDRKGKEIHYSLI